MKLFDLITTPPINVAHAAYARCTFSYDRQTPVQLASMGEHEVKLPQPLIKALPKRQAEYLAGRICARHAMQQLGGPKVDIIAGVDRAPQWPAGFVGSITHNDSIAAAIMGRVEQFAGLGIDIEEIMEETAAQRLHLAILTPAEIELCPSSLSFAQFTSLIFSAKEALYKATYPLIGQFFGLHDVTLTGVDPYNFHFDMVKDTLPDWHLTVRYHLAKHHCETLLALPADWPATAQPD